MATSDCAPQVDDVPCERAPEQEELAPGSRDLTLQLRVLLTEAGFLRFTNHVKGQEYLFARIAKMSPRAVWGSEAQHQSIAKQYGVVVHDDFFICVAARNIIRFMEYIAALSQRAGKAKMSKITLMTNVKAQKILGVETMVHLMHQADCTQWTLKNTFLEVPCYTSLSCCCTTACCSGACTKRPTRDESTTVPTSAEEEDAPIPAEGCATSMRGVCEEDLITEVACFVRHTRRCKSI